MLDFQKRNNVRVMIIIFYSILQMAKMSSMQRNASFTRLQNHEVGSSNDFTHRTRREGEETSIIIVFKKRTNYMMYANTYLKWVLRFCSLRVLLLLLLFGNLT